MALIDRFLDRMVQRGELTVIFPNGRQRTFGTPDPELGSVTIRMKDRKVFAQILADPALGAAESYMDGRLEVEQGDIRDLIVLARANDAWENKRSTLGEKEDRHFLWRKSILSWSFLYVHFLQKAEWFMRADDDSFVFVDNLRRYVVDTAWLRRSAATPAKKTKSAAVRIRPRKRGLPPTSFRRRAPKTVIRSASVAGLAAAGLAGAVRRSFDAFGLRRLRKVPVEVVASGVSELLSGWGAAASPLLQGTQGGAQPVNPATWSKEQNPATLVLDIKCQESKRGVYQARLCRSLDGWLTREVIDVTIYLKDGTNLVDEGNVETGPGNIRGNNIIGLPDGTLLVPMYGSLQQDVVWFDLRMFGGHLKYPQSWPRQFKYRSWVLRSQDGGLTWHYHGTIAALPELGDEGFCEPNIAVLQDGSLIAILRNGGGDDGPGAGQGV